MTAGPGPSFAVLLRRLRKAAFLTQEDLAHAARLSSRAISDLERGLTRTTRRDTASRLADALNLRGSSREDFVAMALGRSPASGSARSAVADWQSRRPVDAAWLSWVDALIRLTAEGRLPPVAARPLPSVGGDPFLDREQQAADLNGFLDRIEQGRGGCALVAGPAGIGKSRLLVKVLAGRLEDVQVEWMTFDRGEAGYQGWRRLLAPLWNHAPPNRTGASQPAHPCRDPRQHPASWH